MDCKWWFPALPLLKYPDVRSSTVLGNPPFSSHIWNFLDGHLEEKKPPYTILIHSPFFRIAS